MTENELTKIWFRFLKEKNILIPALKIYERTHGLNGKELLQKICLKNNYETIFQKALIFCCWSNSTQGHVFWYHVNISWKAHLYSLGVDIDIKLFRNQFYDAESNDMERLKIRKKYPSIEKIIK